MGALGGGPKAPAGPITQTAPAINIVNNNHNLTAPAGMGMGGGGFPTAQQGFGMGFENFGPGVMNGAG